MTDDEAAERIREIDRNSEDIEETHQRADNLLCEILKSYGYAKTVEAFENMDKWYA